ncbi:MAG: helix-turn-helix domain-containing protein [Bacteroidales bacterium]|nr:helix-turn-helix domain-containing protein [Bacteroidales bacterium]
MNITGKIQSLRKDKGWTITQLSRETNIPTVSLRVMLSRDDPNGYTIKNLVKIAEALGVTVSYLTLEDNERETPSLTVTQREEIKQLIAETIDNYFQPSGQETKSADIIRKTSHHSNYADLED